MGLDFNTLSPEELLAAESAALTMRSGNGNRIGGGNRGGGEKW